MLLPIRITMVPDASTQQLAHRPMRLVDHHIGTGRTAGSGSATASCRSGWEVLMDKAVEPTVLDSLRQITAANAEGALEVHDLRPALG